MRYLRFTIDDTDENLSLSVSNTIAQTPFFPIPRLFEFLRACPDVNAVTYGHDLFRILLSNSQIKKIVFDFIKTKNANLHDAFIFSSIGSHKSQKLHFELLHNGKEYLCKQGICISRCIGGCQMSDAPVIDRLPTIYFTSDEGIESNKWLDVMQKSYDYTNLSYHNGFESFNRKLRQAKQRSREFFAQSFIHIRCHGGLCDDNYTVLYQTRIKKVFFGLWTRKTYNELSPNSVLELIPDRPYLVYLDACESGKVPELDESKPYFQLIDNILSGRMSRFAIGHTRPILQDDAELFSTFLYNSIFTKRQRRGFVNGWSLQRAVNDARIELMSSQFSLPSNQLSWYLPALYIRVYPDIRFI